ncbi:MAG: XRE family transcriptional regulator [Verrucomicrobiota bacterium]
MNLVELAQRIRAARAAKGMTLDEVSAASGLGKGLLSKVENFRVTPTLPTLAKLCETLGVKLSELVEGLDKKPKLCVVRRNQRKTIERDSGDNGGSNIVYHSLAHARANRTMDPFELVVPAHGGRLQAMPHEGEEFLIVLKGKVEFEFDGKVESLEEGDSLYFDAETDHRLFNVNDKEARVLCVFLERAQ